MSVSDVSGTLALLLALGATEDEAVAVVERFAGQRLGSSPRAIMDQAKLFLVEHRGLSEEPPTAS